MGSKHANLLVIGLDNAGKTAIINWLKEPERVAPIPTTPTIGYQKQQFKVNGIVFQVYDMSGQSKYRDLWTNYASKVHGVMFVVDASDRMRVNVAASELEVVLEERSLPRDVPVLIMANKSDAKEAVRPKEVAEIMKVNQLARECEVFRTCALNGEGIEQAVLWLSQIIKERMEKGK